MKLKSTPIPSHPHTATLKPFQNGAGPPFHMITVEIAVPSRVAAMLPENGCAHIISCAGIGYPDLVKPRARYWKSCLRVGSKTSQPLASLLEPAVAEGCDTPILIAITPNEWHLVGILCGKLGITAGQWFLACASHAAECEQEKIEAQLSAIAEAKDPAAGVAPFTA